MPTYQREVRIRASLADVWDFHSTADGLRALTPSWMNLQIESIQGPDGDPDPRVLSAGSVIDASVRPFGLGSPQEWRSEITERERTDGSAYFVDEMIGGPFEYWRHTHRFFADEGTTICQDHVEYRLPLGSVGAAVAPLARIGLDPMFRYRHRRTRELLEGPKRP